MSSINNVGGSAAILVASVQQKQAHQQLQAAQTAQSPADSILLSAVALASLSGAAGNVSAPE